MNLQFVSGPSLDKAYPNLPMSNEGYQSNNQDVQPQRKVASVGIFTYYTMHILF